MFNRYQWGIYLQSGGNRIVKIFENALDLKKMKDFSHTVKILIDNFCPCKGRGVGVEQEINDKLIKPLMLKNKMFFYFNFGKKYTIKSGLESLIENRKFSESELLEWFLFHMECLTTHISLEKSELFIPYYFQRNFNVLSYIIEMFNIELDLSKIPVKSDFKGRFYYYGEICGAFHKFREINGLSIAELWAFLYDYGPNCVGGKQYIKKSLPEPRSAFLIGGTSEDLFFNSPELKKYPQTTFWQCNPDTRAGDMVIFYMTSPYSKIDSIWQSVSEGFSDTFFWYYRCTYIGYPQKLNNNKFTIKQMKQNNILNKLPIIKKNMQGVNGTQISPQYYNYIAEKSGLTNLPKISFVDLEFDFGINNEHDVEIKFLEPLLEPVPIGQNLRIRV